MKTATLKLVLVALFAVAIAAPAAHAALVAKDGTTTTAVHTTFRAIDSIDCYGSGNEDSFAEYGVTTFNFTAADFGGLIGPVLSATLTLTVNDRSFSDGDKVEIFFTPDTATDLGGDFASLSFESALVNGIDGAQYVTAPVSLGVFAIPEMAGRAGGETDVLSLSLSPAVKLTLANAINTGTDFQIIVAATQSSHDITYSGVGNPFDPGDPNLELEADLAVQTLQSTWGKIKATYK